MWLGIRRVRSVVGWSFGKSACEAWEVEVGIS